MKTLVINSPKHGLISSMVDDEDFIRFSTISLFAVWNERSKTFYVKRYCRNNGHESTAFVHREIMGLKIGDPLQVDHIDHNGLNNQKSNLRVCTMQQNNRNRRSSKKRSSHPKGVDFCPDCVKPWRARIIVSKKLFVLGHFLTPEEAHAAYLDACRVRFGAFACV